MSGGGDISGAFRRCLSNVGVDDGVLGSLRGVNVGVRREEINWNRERKNK